MTKKFYTITKTVPGSIYFELSPIDNSQLSKIVKLTPSTPSARFPLSWVLGVFADPSVYKMFEQGAFTFKELDEVLKMAQEEQLILDNELDFKPTTVDFEDQILIMLKGGKAKEIKEFAVDKNKEEILLSIAQKHVGELTTNVIKWLENNFKCQLMIDED